MKLPTIQTPVYKTKLISNNKQILLRPFLVKEEKILLTSMQTQDKETIIENYIQILKNCILTENIDIDNMPSFDAVYIFIELRKKSMGEIINISIKDTENGKYFDVEMDLNEVKIVKNKKINEKIQLTEQIGIILKYPTIRQALDLSLEKTQDFDPNKITDILINCIDKIYDTETVYNIQDYTKEEIVQFIDQMSPSMVASVSDFFANIPKVIFEKEYISPFTGKNVKVRIENFMDFLI
jgi:hypothetical protein